MTQNMQTVFISRLIAAFIVAQFIGLSRAQFVTARAASPVDCNSVKEIPLVECTALIDLFTQTNGPTWSDQTNWDKPTPCSTPWFGITCTTGNVTAIDLRGNNLAGTLPDTINALTFLRSLNLNASQLSGTIPILTGLTNLQYLHLSNNQLIGTIPSLSGLTNLVILYLDNNQLNGTFPSLSGLTKLVALDVENNRLSGTIPNLSELVDVEVVNLSYNQLSGTIPNLSELSSLQNFFLGDNRLSGTIPTLSRLINLQILDLSSNQLSGSIPSLVGMTNLRLIDLHSNQLSGLIPSLSNLTHLQELELAENQLSKAIPSLNDLIDLGYVDLSYNQFTGGIPDMPPSLQHLDVRNNLLNGSISPSLSATAITLYAPDYQSLFLCGGGNVLTTTDPALNAFIAARVAPGWTGSCNAKPPTSPASTPNATFF